MGTFAWETSFRNVRLETVASDLSLGSFRLEASPREPSLESFHLGPSLGYFRFGTVGFAWEVRLVSFVSGPSLRSFAGNVRFGTVA